MLSWLRAGSKRGERAVRGSASVSVAATPPLPRDALLAAAERAGRLIQVVYELAAKVEAEAKSHDWPEGDILALFRDGVLAWSSLFAYGLLRVRHDTLRGADAIGDDGLRHDWAMASAKLAEQVAGQDAAGVGDAARLQPTIANMLDQYDQAAAKTAATIRQPGRDGPDSSQAYGPLHELASHGFGGPGDAVTLAARFEALIAALEPAADGHIRQIYS